MDADDVAPVVLNAVATRIRGITGAQDATGSRTATWPANFKMARPSSARPIRDRASGNHGAARWARAAASAPRPPAARRRVALARPTARSLTFPLEGRVAMGQEPVAPTAYSG